MLAVTGSTCYHDRVQLSPFTRHITSTPQGSSSIAEHCRVPPWWLVRQKCFNTVLQHWLCRDTWPSHAAGLTCLACEICAGPGWGGVAVCLSDAALVLLHRHHCSWLFLPEVQKPGVSLWNPKCATFSKLRNSLLWMTSRSTAKTSCCGSAEERACLESRLCFSTNLPMHLVARQIFRAFQGVSI